jgi:hypothetical protein
MRAHKPDGCQYDDGRGKTRTQALRERIQRLEEEIAQLRDPEYAAPAIVLTDPHAMQQGQLHAQAQAQMAQSMGMGMNNAMAYFGLTQESAASSSTSSESPAGSPSSGGGLSTAASPYSSFGEL